MPRLKPKTEATPAPCPTEDAANGIPHHADVLTLSEAAAYLRLSEDQLLRAVREQGLPCRRLGADWRFLKTAVQDWLSASPQQMSNKDAWLALAGVWQDDPLVDAELRETHRRRGRQATEDES